MRLDRRITADDIDDLAIPLGKLAQAVQDAISGGGYTSPLTTKGDLLVHGTVDARLPVGSNTQVLTADSSQTLGVKWAPVPATDLSAYSTTSQANALYAPVNSSFQRGFGTQSDNGSTNLSPSPLIAYLALATPGNPFTTFTINLNAGATDGQHCKFVMPGGCTTLTVQGGGGSPAAVKGGLVAAVAGVVYDFVFDAVLGSNGTWYLVN